MIIRVENIEKKIRDAVTMFCMEQSCGGYKPSEIAKLANSAFAVFRKIPSAVFIAKPVYRYQVFAGEFTDEILPEDIKDSDILFERAVTLGTFTLDTYSSDVDGGMLFRGYDVVYDVDSKKICLLYKIIMSDEDCATTIYRVQTDMFENFNAGRFVVSLSTQILGKMKQDFTAVGKDGIKVCIKEVM